MAENTYLEMKLLKNPFSKLFPSTTKALGKQKTPKNFSIRKPALPFNLITLNASNLLKVLRQPSQNILVKNLTTFFFTAIST